MKQYHDLLKEIKEKGTWKDPAREGMPRTLSLFGAQSRYNLADGFPLLTTKKINFKHIVVELLWFLRGDTNIKYLVDRGCNIWNEDAFNYYKKKFPKSVMTFEDFIDLIKNSVDENGIPRSVFFETPIDGYRLGDCGKQYGWLWRSWDTTSFETSEEEPNIARQVIVDQVKGLIEGLKNSPLSRRHILNAWNPATLDQMALHPCHVLSQFNCRPIPTNKRGIDMGENGVLQPWMPRRNQDEILDEFEFPKYYLDCQMYQRSADVFLGVPYNIASYALLTHILCKICNMIPGDFIHSFGDVHIYDNHIEQVDEILTREPRKLPKLLFDTCPVTDWQSADIDDILKSIEGFETKTFQLEGYDPYASIKAKLSTGLK